MRFKLVCVGKLDDRDLASVVARYETRIRRVHPLDVLELPETAGKFKNTREVRRRDCAALESRLAGTRYVACAPTGKEMDSAVFAAWLGKRLEMPGQDMVFVIGGSHGLDEGILRGADEVISFSRLTFPHQLFRALLVEQLYRALTILRGEPYHK